jgi:hypothetical protein
MDDERDVTMRCEPEYKLTDDGSYTYRKYHFDMLWLQAEPSPAYASFLTSLSAAPTSASSSSSSSSS